MEYLLDPFVGSGTTALAAKKLGLNYIGIDINPEYVRIALERLSGKSKVLKRSEGKLRQISMFAYSK